MRNGARAVTRRMVRATVQGMADMAGSRRALAAQLGVNRDAVDDLLNGGRPSPALLRALRLQRVELYARGRDA